MHASGGSGYCDCGDPEAWKRDPYCVNHKPVDASSEGTDNGSVFKLPEMDERRIYAFVASLLQYAVELICWDYSDILPAGLVRE